MFEVNQILHGRWVAMVNSKLVIESHAASVLYYQLLLENKGDEKVQHDPVMLNDLEPNYPVLPSTTRPGLVLRSELRYVQGCNPLRVGILKANPSRVDDLS